jgi:hypothetical protein
MLRGKKVVWGCKLFIQRIDRLSCGILPDPSDIPDNLEFQFNVRVYLAAYLVQYHHDRVFERGA